MELHPQCIPCLVDRAYEESELVFTGDEERIRALAEFISFLGAHLVDSDLRTPPFYGTERARIIQRLSGVRDPHEAAADMLDALVRIAAVANSMEYGVKGYAYLDTSDQVLLRAGRRTGHRILEQATANGYAEVQDFRTDLLVKVV
jgi:uncharacterized protein with ATP-grasp and redox domains